jgi:uncharacterized lipoprotein YddW (UPF0748 family)
VAADVVLQRPSIARIHLSALGPSPRLLPPGVAHSHSAYQSRDTNPFVLRPSYACPQLPRERSYPVDGLHFDFIRYPGPSFDYSRASLEGFRRRSGGSDLIAGPSQGPAAWDAWRRDVLTALTARLADAARAERPGLVLSAAVVPDEAQAVSQKFQDWPAWVKAGLIAALCPMTYTPDSRLFMQQLEAMRERNGAAYLMWAGIGAYRLDVAGIVEKVTLARLAGAQGVVLFSHESLAPADLRQLGQQVFGARLAFGPEASAGGSLASAR